MQLSTVTLEAKDVPSTVSYLSELLDLEIVALGDDEILLRNHKIEFKVVPGAKNKSRGNIVFDMSVDEAEELNELSQKAQFLHYRFGEKCSVAKRKSNESLEELELTDPDGRLWRFTTFQ
jgi:predicted lactoylglutathione lyase